MFEGELPRGTHASTRSPARSRVRRTCPTPVARRCRHRRGPAAPCRSTACARRCRSLAAARGDGAACSTSTRPRRRTAAAAALRRRAHVLARAAPPGGRPSTRSSPRDDLGARRQLPLRCSPATSPTRSAARAVEQYLISTIDHGFNASTFTARVIASTGADVGAARRRRASARSSGPLHGGAPSRALRHRSTRSARPDTAPTPWIRAARRDAASGSWASATPSTAPRTRARVLLARRSRASSAAPLADFAVAGRARGRSSVLAELKPGRELHTNVEFYAGVVMELCGLPRELFTPDVRRRAG